MDRLISILNIPTFERRALIVLLFFALFIVIVKYYQNRRIPKSLGISEMELEILKSQLDSLLSSSQEVKYRMFNPNQDHLDSLLSKGLPTKLAYNIINYRTKVRPFEVPEDLLKLYSMDSILWHNLHSYIVLPEQPRSLSAHEAKPKKLIDLNNCTANNLEDIKGIGPVLSKRIISYRNILGGYIRTNQLMEVYGIEEELFLKMKSHIYPLDSMDITKIKLNTIEFKTLLRHPYWNYQQVKELINYRKAHTVIESIDEIIKMDIMSKSELERVLPYIEL